MGEAPLHLRALQAMIGPSPIEATEPEKVEKEAFDLALEIYELEQEAQAR